MGIEIAKEAIDTAESWLETANTMAGKGIYNTALYSEEMAVEIALKAVMLAVDVEPPKIHNIIEIMENNTLLSRKIPKEKYSDVKRIVRTLLPELLRSRQTSGYTFNYNIDRKELKTLALKYLVASRDALNLCKNVIKEIGTAKK